MCRSKLSSSSARAVAVDASLFGDLGMACLVLGASCFDRMRWFSVLVEEMKLRLDDARIRPILFPEAVLVPAVRARAHGMHMYSDSILSRLPE